MDGRRDFLIAALVGGAGGSGSAAQDGGRPRPGAVSVDGLGLTHEARADLERFAEPVLRDVAYLAELPLDKLDPAFVFIPRG